MKNLLSDARDFAILFFKGFSVPRILSIDITNKCNLNCKTCYFSRTTLPKELSDKEWIEKIWRFKLQHPHSYGAWCGGEPLLRKELVKTGMKFFRHNLLITNGTIDWSDLPANCSILVSLDGIGEQNDVIRGNGVYKRVINNLMKSNRFVATTTTISRINFESIPGIVKEFRSLPNVSYAYFTFYTPQISEAFSLCLTEPEREKTLDLLLKLKGTYGSFIADSRLALELMREKNRKAVIADCPHKRACFCLNSQGERKQPCILGPTVDCQRCGDYEAFHLKAIEMRDIESIRVGFRLLGIDTFKKK